MEDLLKITRMAEECDAELMQMQEDFIAKLRINLFGTPASASGAANVNGVTGLVAASPQQTKKRAKRLTSLSEAAEDNQPVVRKSRSSQEEIKTEKVMTEEMLMPPPATSANDSNTSGRPQRAAKLNCAKNLKEPTLNSKLRREDVQVKLEHEQRRSQQSIVSNAAKSSLSEAEQSVVVVAKPPAVIVLASDGEEDSETVGTEPKKKSLEKTTGRAFRVMVKREQPSMCSSTSDEPNATSSDCASTVATAASTATKKGRKKKDHRPIKVERFSDIPSPVAARTRKGRSPSVQQPSQPDAEKCQGISFYEDAVDNPAMLSSAPDAAPTETSKASEATRVRQEKAGISDATIILGGAPSDETFRTNNDGVAQSTFVIANNNTTVTLAKATVGNETFNVCAGAENKRSASSSRQSMETAKDTSNPEMTEDECVTPRSPPRNTAKPTASKLPTPSKNYKMPTRTNELFNPLIQSPVKMKVKAFENATKAPYLTRAKENSTPNAHTNVGRFLTPTQTGNLPMATVKKAPNSTSKLMTFPKPTAASGHSAEEMRRGLQQLADERKRQREQKHLLAAQQREAKERERAERLAKLAKEREEKRLKKLQEAEQKKKLLEEAERKQRHQEEMAAAEMAKQKAAKKAIIDQEREMLANVKQISAKKMMPPPPRTLNKYTFEMLNEGDSTDEEGKTSKRRPPPPSWSIKSVRGAAILGQQPTPTDVIDSFFSVQPMTPDLRQIFPNIDARHLKRNSSVLWSSPVRYSELPKY